jgi:hypothetical protein
LIGGPVADGDPSAYALRDVIFALQVDPQYQGRVHGKFEFVAYTDALEIYLASALFLMPSKYEPGGLTQLESLAAGTAVVAHEVGGIADTLNEFDARSGIGDAFFFQEFTSKAFSRAMSRGIAAVGDKGQRKVIMVQAAAAAHDWSDKVPFYLAMLRNEAGVFAYDYPNLRKEKALLDRIIARPPGTSEGTKRSEVREISGETENGKRGTNALNMTQGALPANETRSPQVGVETLELPSAVPSESRADKMVRAIRKSVQPATVFVNAEDFPNLSAEQKNEYFYVALSGRGVRIVVYNQRSEVRDKELGALLKLDRVARTDRDLAGAQISFERPGALSLHLSKEILPSRELVQRLRKKVSFFKTQGQHGGTLAAALLWAWSGGEDARLREISRGWDGFWVVADSLVNALQRSYNATLAFAVAA